MAEKFKIAFLKGKKIILRPLEEKDINARYLSWINDKKITKYMETGVFPTTLKELQNFYNKTTKSKTDVIFAIINKKNRLHIGNIKLVDINWIHRFAYLGIMIGDRRYWGKGYGEEACKILLEYAFNRLNLNKIILGVYAIHKRAVESYAKIGFRREGKIKKLFYSDGEYVDKIIMGVLKEEFNKLYK